MAGRYDERYRGEAYGRGREAGHGDRGFMDRAGDEVRSWFGDDEAARRRERDVERHRYSERGWGEDRGRHDTYSRGSSRYDPSWERRGGYGSADDRSSRRWESEPEWRTEPSAADAYRGYAGLSSSRGWTGGSPERDELRRERYDTLERDVRGSTMGYPPYSGWEMPGAGSARGQFAGRGPKGYQRSDDRIREDVCDRLTDDPDIDASDIEVAVNRGEVTLSGAVRTRDDKRRAEDAIERISGVREVHNTLRVSRSDTAGTDYNPGNVIGVGGTAVSPRSGTHVDAPNTRR